MNGDKKAIPAWQERVSVEKRQRAAAAISIEQNNITLFDCQAQILTMADRRREYFKLSPAQRETLDDWIIASLRHQHAIWPESSYGLKGHFTYRHFWLNEPAFQYGLWLAGFRPVDASVNRWRFRLRMLKQREIERGAVRR